MDKTLLSNLRSLLLFKPLLLISDGFVFFKNQEFIPEIINAIPGEEVVFALITSEYVYYKFIVPRKSLSALYAWNIDGLKVDDVKFEIYQKIEGPYHSDVKVWASCILQEKPT